MTGQLYGVTNNRDAVNGRKLARIDVDTGAGTIIGPLNLGSPDGSIHDLTFDAAGHLFGFSTQRAGNDLYTISLVTGQVTKVGENLISGLLPGDGLAIGGGKMYWGHKTDQPLYTVDPATGILTPGPTMSGEPAGYKLGGLEFDSYNVLYAVILPSSGSAPADLATINLLTGAITTVGRTVDNLSGIAFRPPSLRFIPLTPCRVADTRNATGPFGGPRIGGGAANIRDFTIPNGACGIPASAKAYSLNVTVVPAGPLGYLSLWPTGELQPVASILNSVDGRAKSNAAIVPAGTAGAISVFASNPTDLVLDINGYFVPDTDPAGLAFYPVKPCRVADTRNPNGPLGGPF